MLLSGETAGVVTLDEVPVPRPVVVLELDTEALAEGRGVADEEAAMVVLAEGFGVAVPIGVMLGVTLDKGVEEALGLGLALKAGEEVADAVADGDAVAFVDALTPVLEPPPVL